MPDVSIRTLKLRLTGLSPDDGERVARAVVGRLASGSFHPAEGRHGTGALETTLSARRGETVERMAARIAEAIRAGLER